MFVSRRGRCREREAKFKQRHKLTRLFGSRGACEGAEGAREEGSGGETTVLSWEARVAVLSREEEGVVVVGGDIARVDPFPYLPSTVVRCSGYRATTRRRKPNLEINPMRSEALSRRSNSRGDNRRQERKKKIGDHKEDLRQKPHDRRRQSTYLHAVPERRCPSVAGSWCYSDEKFPDGSGGK